MQGGAHGKSQIHDPQRHKDLEEMLSESLSLCGARVSNVDLGFGIFDHRRVIFPVARVPVRRQSLQKIP